MDLKALEMKTVETEAPRLKKGGCSAGECFSGAMAEAMGAGRADEPRAAGKTDAKAAVEKEDAVRDAERPAESRKSDDAEGCAECAAQAVAQPSLSLDVSKAAAPPASGEIPVIGSDDAAVPASAGEAAPEGLKTENAPLQKAVAGVFDIETIEAEPSGVPVPAESEAVAEGDGELDATAAKRLEKASVDEGCASSADEQAAPDEAPRASTRPEGAGDGHISIEAAFNGAGDGALAHGGEGGTGEWNQGGRAMEAGGVSVFGRDNVSFEAAATAKPLSAAERVEVFEKFSAGVRMSFANNGGEVRLALRPEHLGSLNIRLNIDESLVKARVLVESAAVKDLLDSDAGALREIFAKNGLVLDRYSIELNSGPSGLDKGAHGGQAGFSAFGHNNPRTRAYGGDGTGRSVTNDDEILIAAAQQAGAPPARGIDLFA